MLWRVVGGLGPLRYVGKEGTFCIFGLGKDSVYGVMEGWNSGTFCICYVNFFFSISFVYIELCLRTTNAITHYT